MALPLPQGKNFIITHRKLSGDFEMPSMEVASDHYSIGFIIHGDRKVITPTISYVLHKGYVNTVAPFLYHRTIPASTDYYESYLIKFSPEMAADFTNAYGSKVLEAIFKHPPKHFSEEDEKKIFDLAAILLEMYDAHEATGLPEDPAVLFKYKNLLYTILSFISDRGIDDTEKSVVHTAALSEPIMEAVYYMEKNYRKPIKIEDVASVSGYSVSYFSRLFTSQLGRPFSEYLCITRLKHVQNLLLTTDMSVTDISLECGFSYPGNMTACFKKEFAMTPLQFRKQNAGRKKK
ncbi:AraC family transcriptional regulator [Butyrivibrio sp. CB08]|uniref:helix-turn-helix transcriptional regulator n=1 Tax=Butyrivibrio sp. CB08 TaxID=2364879 RepID=UPI000EA8DE4E|nr:AraC family transcriptional regulator [Butyrivibrio sp. CB08]RKM61907.1 AraC family transcriptional regulator [Butyrivibrio sp. CB08]